MAPTCSPPRRFRPRLECLEAREAPAVDVVMNTADSGNGSLRAVIAAASNGDTINFDPSIKGQTITLTSGPISTSLNLTIDGTTQGITISGGNSSQIFNFTNSTAALNETINNLIFSGGKNVGGSGNGGAIYVQGSLSLTGDQFNNNQANYGGAVYVNPFAGTNGSLSVTGTKFNFNTASTGYGGAIAVAANMAGDNVTLDSTSFTSNSSAKSGGAVEAAGTASTTMMVTNGCVFNGNSVTGSGDRTNYYGGAIDTTDQLTVQGSSTTAILFQGNNAVDGGGAIDYRPAGGNTSSMTLTNVTFTGNWGESGGAVYSNVNTTANTVTINVSGSTFSANQAKGADSQYVSGGGIFLNHVTSGTGSAQATITNSTFYQNSSDENGGGIAVQLNNSGTGLNTVSLTSLTVYKNQASTQGGGLWVSLTGTGSSTAVVYLHNSIVAGNTINNPASNGPDVFFTILGNASNLLFKSQGYNLIGIKDGGVTWSSSDYVGTSSNPLVPSLDPNGLQDNGGPTQTIKLIPPAGGGPGGGYRQGDPSLLGTTDQRGFTRNTYISIGAYDPDAS